MEAESKKQLRSHDEEQDEMFSQGGDVKGRSEKNS